MPKLKIGPKKATKKEAPVKKSSLLARMAEKRAAKKAAEKKAPIINHLADLKGKVVEVVETEKPALAIDRGVAYAERFSGKPSMYALCESVNEKMDKALDMMENLLSLGMPVNVEISAKKVGFTPPTALARPTLKSEPEPEPKPEPVAVKVNTKDLPPGVTLDEENNIGVDVSQIEEWNEKQMLLLGTMLEMDLSEYEGKPRAMRRVLTEKINEGEDVVSMPDTSRPTAKMGEKVRTMPGALAEGEDGFPVSSPYIGDPDGRVDVVHVPRAKWRTGVQKIDGKKWNFGFMHKVAEVFREAVVEADKWDCEGRNCHDCIEGFECLSQLVLCHKDYELEFEFPSGSSDFGVDDKDNKYIAKHEVDE